uniref:3-dehydrosphinganine reductase n=1 Tax=Romanomermis culicivorax TaxID=13658 RepID=A0A915J859_ROMCU
MILLVISVVAVFLSAFLALKLLLLGSPKKFKNLVKRHVVITGGSKGIGRALAIEAVKSGCDVTIVARNAGQLEKVESELKSLANDNQISIKTIALDLTNDFQSIKDTLENHFGRNGTSSIDILINNAGATIDGEFEKLRAEDFEQEMKINYLSAVYVTKALMPFLKESARRSEYESRKFLGSRIVFLSSQAGQLGLYGYSAYSSSKFALRGLAECLQMELKPANVWITVAYPPNTDTEGFSNECLQMPEATRIISGTAGLVQPDVVAKKILSAAVAGHFCCYFGSDGWLLSSLCGGMSPENNVLNMYDEMFQYFLKARSNEEL